jgi:hypothetical protein
MAKQRAPRNLLMKGLAQSIQVFVGYVYTLPVSFPKWNVQLSEAERNNISILQ